MKANEFVKLKGISYCKELLIKADGCAAIQAREDNSRISVDDLKSLVESHDLIESCGGLHSVGEKLTHGMYESRAVIDRLEQAISDVESCQ